VEPGQFDPQGLPGEHGPRSEPVCFTVVSDPGAEPKTSVISGKTITAKATTEAKGRAVTALIFTDRNLVKWGSTFKARVFAQHFFEGDSFKAKWVTRGAKSGFVCAIRSTDFQEFTYVHVGGCLPTAHMAGKNADGLVIPMAQLETTLELIGFSAVVPQALWPGTEARKLSGQITSTGNDFGGALVAVGAIPLMEETDTEANPGALALTNASGRFEVNFLAQPGDPIFLCGLSLPRNRSTIATAKSLNGVGCKKIERPKGAGDSQVVVNNIALQLDASKAYPMTDHEREHYSFLAECLGKSN
jgi:hypothetical protein